MLNGKKAPLYGNGKQVRDWIFVRYHCKAIDLILKKGIIGETYLIGSKNQKTNIEIVAHIAKILDMDLEECVEFIEDRPDHDVRYAINPNNIKEELGWKPHYSFDEAIRKTCFFLCGTLRFILRVKFSY